MSSQNAVCFQHMAFSGDSMTDIPGCLTDKFFLLFTGHKQLAGLVDIPDEYYTVTQNSPPDRIFHAITAAFLISLCGRDHPKYTAAQKLLDSLAHHGDYTTEAQFFLDGCKTLSRELTGYLNNNSDVRKMLNDISRTAQNKDSPDMELIYKQTQDFFFPEGAFWPHKTAAAVKALREKRTVSISQLNRNPLQDAAAELIFTSNVLLTVPSGNTDIDKLDLDPELKEQVKAAAGEQQQYWFDHPIQIGVDPQHNEVLYGLSMLNGSLRAEVDRGNLPGGRRVRCVLSVSVTHLGLKRLARPYLEAEFRKHGGLDLLDVFVFTEDDTVEMISQVFRPLAQRYKLDASAFADVFGVDGEYGRHYSFLKAMVAVWQVFIDPRVRATFKIDLDQVFPQEELIQETGKSALEHLMSPLWGADGTDYRGRKVHLGMIAGALVNEADISKGLFTPDVKYPAGELSADALIFASKLPQALSTEAEMMARYEQGSEPDGKKTYLQRIHITGGTNGISVESLRKYRPFTPSIIGRAEDQAFIMSALFDAKDGALLRYGHASGLIMRHDKEAFAADAIEAAGTGKAIGDYIRMLLFSAYARLLPGGADAVKDELGPFTGCFISPFPYAQVLLRFALSCAWRFVQGDAGACDFFAMGIERIGSMMSSLESGGPSFKDIIQKERGAWNNFYDLLDRVEGGLEAGDDSILTCQKKLLNIVSRCRMQSG